MITVKLYRPDETFWWYPASGLTDARKFARTHLSKGDVVKAEVYRDYSEFMEAVAV